MTDDIDEIVLALRQMPVTRHDWRLTKRAADALESLKAERNEYEAAFEQKHRHYELMRARAEAAEKEGDELRNKCEP